MPGEFMLQAAWQGNPTPAPKEWEMTMEQPHRGILHWLRAWDFSPSGRCPALPVG